MSNLPPNPYNSVPGGPQMNTNPGKTFNHNPPFGSVPSSQLPPGYGGLKDANSNSPVHGIAPPPTNLIHNVNNYNQSASNSPAFNQPGVMPTVPGSLQPHSRPQTTLPPSSKPFSNVPLSANPRSVNPSPTSYPSSYNAQRQINDTAPPLIPSSQINQPLMNGPPVFASHGLVINQYPVSSSYSTPPISNQQVSTGFNPMNPLAGQVARPPGPPLPSSSQSTTSHTGPSLPGPPRSSPQVLGPPPFSGPPNAPSNIVRPPSGPLGSQTLGINGPNAPPHFSGPTSSPTGLKPPQGSSGMPPPVSTSSMQSYTTLQYNGPAGQSLNPLLPPGQSTFAPNAGSMGQPVGPPSGPMTAAMPPTNLQGRYPQPQTGYNHQPQMPPQPGTKPYPQYNTQGVTQQMGQLSVTKQGFDQLWGHHMMDLLQCKQILPEYPEDPPEIRLAHQFADSPNCSSEIFRCTLNRIPETNSLLQKSRLPLGILIHPFKDLNHLPVIQCTTIVRCRACRTYINPFVYFVDAKRWKCNLCYRVNDLPEEFQYDPVSKSYGDPSRRPEIKSATIEFIAPGEYMLRPPQPAVYLFLFDVSQIARDSRYLQVVCDTLKENLDQLPGDARTQIGFICYDAHIHYYLMSDGLTRPKEMTILDIDDVFLPSPESLLVNLGERRELIRELLTVLPQRYSAPGNPSSALGAALQAAYKLMAPTGGRITVFQTCLPNIGPGALQPREDPNARSSKDVAHLNPATDFYKRIALDCSGAQVAVDLFLLNSQYSDLATLSGMSKFSGGTVYHLPLFRAARPHQAEQLKRVLTRYLTRKIGFEAVMRVRCTRGIAIHTFHGNFFVRSTDLLSLPNVSPDAGFGMQLTIEESLSDLQHVCFQAALLYTSSKGERRIRVHTMALPIASNLTEVLHAADQECIIGLVSKMAVDRSVSASLGEAREALMNVAVDALSAHRLAQNLPAGAASASLHAPSSLRLLPLYLSALLKRKAFRTGTSTRLDDRVSDMCTLKCSPLGTLLLGTYPALYPAMPPAHHTDSSDPPRLHLTAERINSTGAYLLDDGECMILYVGSAVSPAYLSEMFGVTAFSQLPDEGRSLPTIETEGNTWLHAFIDKLNDDRPYPSELIIMRENSPSRLQFTERLVDDRVESAFSYYEFLQHVKSQVK